MPRCYIPAALKPIGIHVLMELLRRAPRAASVMRSGSACSGKPCPPGSWTLREKNTSFLVDTRLGQAGT